MPMFKRGCVLLLLMSAAACGPAGNAPSSNPTQAAVTVTVSPNPVTATACAPPCLAANTSNLYQFNVAGTLTIQETAGIGGNVDSITTTLCSPSCVLASADIVQRSGTSRLAARGTLAVPLSFVYGLTTTPNPSRSVVIPLTVQVTDDRGNKVTSAVVQWTAN
jgi:hypothetical protein